MNNYIIRKLNLDDYEQFLKIINEFRETQYSYEKFKEFYEQIKLSSDIYVIVDNNNIIGTATIIYEYKFIFNTCIYAHIEDVCINSTYRGKGVGKLLVNYLVNVAREKKCYKITLDCADNNVEFYTKCNFEKRGNQMCILLKY